MNPDSPTSRRCGCAGQLQLASSRQAAWMSKITGILPVESAGAPARIPRAQKDGAIESGCRAASEPRGRTKGAAACRFACPALVFDGITKRAGHGQLRGGYREDPGGARVPWPKRRGGGGSRARGRGPKSRGRQRNWRIVVPGMPCSTGRALPPAGCLSLPTQRPRRRRGLLAQCGITQGCHPRAEPAPLPHRARFWAQKQAETGPSGLFFRRGSAHALNARGFWGRREAGAAPGPRGKPRFRGAGAAIGPVWRQHCTGTAGSGRPAGRLARTHARADKRAGCRGRPRRRRPRRAGGRWRREGDLNSRSLSETRYAAVAGFQARALPG